jgi:photosynthetic reaction center H subunit
MIGALTNYIDVAQIVLYVFWVFFAGLIFYLRREDKREGYPMETDRGSAQIVGFPKPPSPKTFLIAHGGGTRTAPRVEARETVAANPTGPWPGSPLEPIGDPMLNGVGPAAYALRAQTPDLTVEGHPKLAPLRVATDFGVEAHDPDPRGMPVFGADNQVGGTVTDVWVDRSEPQIRYLEVEVNGAGGARRVLLPINYARIDRTRRNVKVVSILSKHFANVPGLANPDVVTAREEDRITAYYAGGQLYAEPSRMGPLV